VKLGQEIYDRIKTTYDEVWGMGGVLKFVLGAKENRDNRKLKLKRKYRAWGLSADKTDGKKDTRK